MSKTTVLLLGATGETGGAILTGLVEDGSFDIRILVQPSSANKPQVKQFQEQGLKVLVGDIQASTEDLASLISGNDIIISAIGATAQDLQMKLVDAATEAGVKRFIPCGFITISPPTAMTIRKQKEAVYNRIFFHHLPYTIIDVGYWRQLSFPRVPSGRLDYAALIPANTIFNNGEAPNLLVDKDCIGHYLAKIIKDDSTLNKKILIWSDELSQNQITEIVERRTGEKLELEKVSVEQMQKDWDDAQTVDDPSKFYLPIQMDYRMSKYVRRDNTYEMAMYLGYLDAKKLYPELRQNTFEQFVGELLEGKGRRPYPNMTM